MRRRHILRPSKIANYSARCWQRQRRGSAAAAPGVATLRQFPHQALPDKASGTGQREQHAALFDQAKTIGEILH
jgi:hypothetical protein